MGIGEGETKGKRGGRILDAVSGVEMKQIDLPESHAKRSGITHLANNLLDEIVQDCQTVQCTMY